MDKNKMIILLCCMFICSTMMYAQKQKKNSISNKVSYVKEVSLQDENFWLLKNLPKSKISIINDPESAALVASVYVANLYGERISKIEQPYSVCVLNDSLWYVSGTSKKRSKYKQWRGSFVLIIDRYTGRLVSFMHEK